MQTTQTTGMKIYEQLHNDEIKNILSFTPHNQVDLDKPLQHFGKLNGKLILLTPNIIVEACPISFEIENENEKNGGFNHTDISTKCVCCITLLFSFANTITVENSHRISYNYNFPNFFVFICKWTKTQTTICKLKTFYFPNFDFSNQECCEIKKYLDQACLIFERTRLLHFRNVGTSWAIQFLQETSLIKSLSYNSTLKITSHFCDDLSLDIISKQFQGRDLVVFALDQLQTARTVIPLKQLLSNKNLRLLSINHTRNTPLIFDFNEVQELMSGQIETGLKTLYSRNLLECIYFLDRRCISQLKPIESITELEVEDGFNQGLSEWFPNVNTLMCDTARNHRFDEFLRNWDFRVKTKLAVCQDEKIQAQYSVPVSLFPFLKNKNVYLIDSESFDVLNAD